MHYVKKFPCPEKLHKNREEWTKPWVEHYNLPLQERKNSSKPKEHWTEEEIRTPLVQSFENNCGYCGQGINTQEVQGTKRPKGQVDHFFPTSKRPDRVYDWENWIWSCQPCNGIKGNYYDPLYILLNPCDQEDMKCLEIQRDGRYFLKEEIRSNEILSQRFSQTEKKTCMNSPEMVKRRHFWKGHLEDVLTSLLKHYPWLKVKVPKKLEGMKENTREEYQRRVGELLLILDSPDFKKIIRHFFHSFVEKNPLIKAILEEIQKEKGKELFFLKSI